jgi:hypothetical protein
LAGGAHIIARIVSIELALFQASEKPILWVFVEMASEFSRNAENIAKEIFARH